MKLRALNDDVNEDYIKQLLKLWMMHQIQVRHTIFMWKLVLGDSRLESLLAFSVESVHWRQPSTLSFIVGV